MAFSKTPFIVLVVIVAMVSMDSIKAEAAENNEGTNPQSSKNVASEDPADDGSKTAAAQGGSDAQFTCPEDCEDDEGDSCNLGDPCCFPLTCVFGRCVRTSACPPVGSTCLTTLNQCCTSLLQVCRPIAPGQITGTCQPCSNLYQPCLSPAPNLQGSCCPGLTCVNSLCFPAIG